jgi:DNA primase
MAGLFSESNLDQVRAASDIVDVIGSHLQLKKAGASFVALCPFHKEKTPSFHVNPSRQIFHCFGCQKGGDVFTFVQEYENVDFGEAVRRLAERAGIVLETNQTPGQSRTRELKETLRDIHEKIAGYWASLLASDPRAQTGRDYIAKRQLSAEAVKLFRIGYAPDAWEDTVQWAMAQKLDLAVMEQAGLILKRESGQGYYDRFRGRLIFPICDEQGRVCAFSGRILVDDVKAAKYVNSPETPIFAKRKTFFGLDKSKRAILDAKFALVCEGQIDLISCFMAGARNIVAPLGTAFTAEHARILKRFVNEVVLCFDSDSAGQNAAVRVLDDLLSSGLAIRVAIVPAPHDPDSFIKANGGPAFLDLVAKARGFFDFYLDYLCRGNDPSTDRGRSAIVKAMGEALLKTGSPVLLDAHAQETALRLGVGVGSIRAEFAKLSSHSRPAPAEEEPMEETNAPEAVRPSAKEFWLLKCLFDAKADIAWLQAHLDPQWIEHPEVRQIVAAFLKAQPESRAAAATSILEGLESANARNLLTEALGEGRSIPNVQAQLEDLVLWLRNQPMERQLVRLTQLLAKPDLSNSQQLNFLEQITALHLQRQQPLEPLPGKEFNPAG